jgi:hypothetical protein
MKTIIYVLLASIVLGFSTMYMLRENDTDSKPIRHRPKQEVVIDTYVKDSIEYIIFITEKDAYGNGGGVSVMNHSKELLITNGLRNQIILQ